MVRLLSCVLCVCLLLSGCSRSEPTAAKPSAATVLIDPGHGGFDGGAVAEDGTNEKHINLSISLVLRDILLVIGVPVSMTRDTDQALNPDDPSTTRSKKVSDMQSRLELYEQADTVLSIHQNHFDIPKYSGTQVFYSANHPDSQALALSVRASVLQYLQPENNREIKKATNGIYLLHHTTVPSVLVECGFLSNPEERNRLKDPEYQQAMAFAIALGYLNYTIEK